MLSSKKETAILITKAREIFMKGPHMEFIAYMKALVNPKNLLTLYNGHQSFPIPYSNAGEQMQIVSLDGEIKSPDFDKTVSLTMQDDDVYYLINLPEHIDTISNFGSLTLILSVQANGVSGFMSDVSIGGINMDMASERKLIRERIEYVWKKVPCRGGYLVSIHSKAEEDDVARLISEYEETWIGATDEEKEGTWKWSDGTPWNYTAWDYKKPNIHRNCIYKHI